MTVKSNDRPIVVVGDTLLDVDVVGSVSRLSPDEPAPVLDTVEQTQRPGGAGLAALLAAHYGPVFLITALGADDAGDRLRGLLKDRVELIDIGADHTISKTRIRASGRTLVRVDHVERAGFPLHTRSGVVGDVLRDAAAVLVSDYGRGMTGHSSIREHLGKVPVVWDPHPRGARPVPGTLTVTPNASEARQFSGVSGEELVDAVRQAHHLREIWRAHSVTVTRGPQAAVICARDGHPVVVPVQRHSVSDTCGAGDACAAGIAAAVAEGVDLATAVGRGIQAAGDFLARGGVASVMGHSASAAHPRPGNADSVVARIRAQGGTVVMAGGCFDLLHAGHIAYLQAARDLGDALVVAVNDDASVRRLKGPSRPLVPIEDRVRVLQALECVDAVEVFADSTPERVLSRLRPEIFAKGGDYSGSTIPETQVVRSYGGQVVILPHLEGRSSSRLVHAARTEQGVPTKEENTCQTQTA